MGVKGRVRPAGTVDDARLLQGRRSARSSIHQTIANATTIARNAARRVEEHNSNDLLAANYTRTRRPVALVYQEAAATRSAALKREYEIKQMSRQEKEAMFRRD